MTHWKNKLLALLHDPPSKCLNIGDHRDNAVTLMKAAGFSEEEAKSYCEAADHTAAAADRFPFPWRKISCGFDGQENAFRHPLGGGKGQPTPTLQFHDVRLTVLIISAKSHLAEMVNGSKEIFTILKVPRDPSGLAFTFS